MKLHNNGTDVNILSSDDIISSGKNLGKNLTTVIDDHTSKINDLEKYTKWLYKYGGTGSKSSNNNNNVPVNITGDFDYLVRFCNITIHDNDIQILGDNLVNKSSAPLNISIADINLDDTYYIKEIKVISNGSEHTIISYTSSNSSNSLTEDNDFKRTYNLDIGRYGNKGKISITICHNYKDANGIRKAYPKSIIFTYIQEAYSFNLDIVNNEGRSLFMNTNNVLYTSTINSLSGVNLRINYDLVTDTEINVKCQSIGILENNDVIINDVDRLSGHKDIKFNDLFINGEDNIIGDYSLLLSYYAENVRVHQEVYNFTIVNENDTYVKVKPEKKNAQIYKYNSNNNENIIYEFNTFEKYFNYYEKINSGESLSENEINDIIEYFQLNPESINADNIITILYNELENYKYYVFNAGNINFLISPYMRISSTSEEIYCELGKLDIDSEELSFTNIDLGFSRVLSTDKDKKVSLNCSEPGIYVFSIWCKNTSISSKLYYYIYVYNKDNSFNWYESNLLDIFTNAAQTNYPRLHYYRSGEVTDVFSQYLNKPYIQQFNSGNDVTLCSIPVRKLTSDMINGDCFISLGIQYSYINNKNSKLSKDSQPIISINSSDENNNLRLDIYQDSVKLNNNSATLYIPKENDYVVSNKNNYHLLSIYKRYIYSNDNTPYFEICIYLDGILEGALQSFVNQSAYKSNWNSITLHNANYSINLAEIAYIEHNDDNNHKRSERSITYMDDISIAEYHYKYVEAFYEDSGKNSIKSFNSIKESINILNNLRNFEETDYGMIKVGSKQDIIDISEAINIPIIVFEYEEPSKGYFVKSFSKTADQENTNVTFTPFELQHVYYSKGKTKINLETSGAINIDGNRGKWVIEIQGSSTKLYFVKNLTLKLESTDTGYIYLFTPNFEYIKNDKSNLNTAKNTFLPEKAFTLKADLVDSSHCNNTAIGKFVNHNTKKFDINFDSSSVYHNYVKNCLLGFPVLTFIKVNNASDNSDSDIFFLGIYNFNLGRDSYFNMGYYDPAWLETNEDEQHNKHVDNILKNANGEFVTMRYKLDNTEWTDLDLDSKVIVAEIQGNNSYYDFSQYDPSILLPTSSASKPMFGDFVPEYNYGNGNSDARIKWHLCRLMEHISKGGGYIFEMLKKHFGVHKYEYSKFLNQGDKSSIFNSANQVPTYKIQFKRNTGYSEDSDYGYLISGNINEINNMIMQDVNTDTYTLIPGSETANTLRNNLINLIYDQIIDGNSDNTIEAILDYPSLAEYYTICMAFGLTDSVMKNLNLKTWNSTYNNDYLDNNYVSTHLSEIKGKWYVAFYDMDTAFGRNNDGTYLDYSYFGFSDYWKTNDLDNNETISLPSEQSNISIYRDFKPKRYDEHGTYGTPKIEGFDYPSSYLFAIAKYAAIVFDEPRNTKPNGSGLNGDESLVNKNFDIYVPNNIWVKFRGLPGDVDESSPYKNSVGIGELKNAEYFINNYFSTEIDEIPEQLWNMNYRYKYLKRISIDSEATYGYKYSNSINGSYIGKEYGSFHGRGKNEVKEWLTYRFRMLDAYFNLDNTVTPIKYLHYKNNNYNLVEIKDINGQIIGYNWEDTSEYALNNLDEPEWLDTGYYEINPMGTSILSHNTDISILRDAFSENATGQRYGTINLTVKALDYSPLIVTKAYSENNKKYLLSDSNKKYNIFLQGSGNTDNITFGGSLLWYYIENVNSLLFNKKLTIFNENLQELTLTSGYCMDYEISKLHALQRIYIEKLRIDDDQTYFGGTLTFKNESYDNYPDLKEITLIRTNIDLIVQSEQSISTINYQNSSAKEFQLIDCKNLQTVNLNNSKIDTCMIDPAWTNNISINGVKIINLTIAPKDKTGNNNSLTISNVSTLQSLTILGNFKYISIINCALLNKIYIDNPESVETLIINRCNSEENVDEDIQPLSLYVTSLNNECTSINSDNEIVLNLNAFTNLKEISMYETFGFNIIDISELEGTVLDEYAGTEYESYRFIKLLGSAFEDTKLKEIKSADLYLMIIPSNLTNQKAATFNNSYFGQDGHIIKNNFFVHKSTYSLANLFGNGLFSKRNGGINLELASMILGNRGNNGYCKFIYENKDNIRDLSGMFRGQNIVCSNHGNNVDLTLSSFEYVNDISSIFEYCSNFSYLSNTLFELNGKTLGKYSEIIRVGDSMSISKIEENAFTPIINKITEFNFYRSGLTITSVYNEAGTELLSSSSEYVYNMADLFNGITVDNHITVINGVKVHDNIIVNWNGLFALNNGGTYVAKFPNLTMISDSFSHNNKNDVGFIGTPGIGLEYVNSNVNLIYAFNLNNLYEPIDYSIIHNLNVNRNAIICNDNSFDLYKTCTNEQLVTYITKYNDIGITNLDYAFKKLVLNVSEVDKHTLVLDNELSSFNFKSMNYAFSKMKCTNDIPLIIDSNTLRSFTKVTLWKETFSYITLYQNLPLNMFNQHKNTSTTYNPSDYNHLISNMEGMFSNVKITNKSWFEHENYDININDYNSPLDGSYHYQINTYENEHYLYNPKCVDIENVNNYNSFGRNISTHLILPFDIFYSCIGSCNINRCFENSYFEGIMPDKLFKGTELNENTNAKFENTFKNLLVIPNKVYNPLSEDHKYNFNVLKSNGSTAGLYNDENGFIEMTGIDYNDSDPSNPLYYTGKKMYVYTFIPSEFTKITSLSSSFNFKIVLPNSPKLNEGNNVQEAYAIFNYDSIGEYNNNVFTNSIGLIRSFRNPMPGMYEQFEDHIGAFDSSGEVSQFDPQQYFNILYFMMLPDVSKIKVSKDGTDYNEERIYGLNRNHLGFTYQISNTLKSTLQNNGEYIFNENLSCVLYGYYLNIFDDVNSNFINFNFDRLDPNTDTDLHSSIISINGGGMTSYKQFYDLGVRGLAKFAVLPNILSNDGYKYVLNLPGGEIFVPVIKLLNTLTANDYNTYMTLFKNKLKASL